MASLPDHFSPGDLLKGESSFFAALCCPALVRRCDPIGRSSLAGTSLMVARDTPDELSPRRCANGKGSLASSLGRDSQDVGAVRFN